MNLSLYLVTYRRTTSFEHYFGKKHCEQLANDV